MRIVNHDGEVIDCDDRAEIFAHKRIALNAKLRRGEISLSEWHTARNTLRAEAARLGLTTKVNEIYHEGGDLI